MNRISLITTLMIFILLTACKPEQEATKFNELIAVPIGTDLNLQVQEDHQLTVKYEVSANEDSVDLSVNIVKQPSNGTLTQCQQIPKTEISCTYIPNENFNGLDSITVQSKDGDILSTKTALINIEVTPIDDAPIAYNGSTSGKENLVIAFSVPLAKDPDSSANQLNYNIVAQPTNGQLSDCFSSQGTRSCKYTANYGFRGIDKFTYSVQDNHSLVSNTADFEILVTDPSLSQGLETFTQGVSSISLVEIVWVIDNSGSMNNDQQNLKQNFASFIGNFLDNGKAKFPFNMGVITSDTYKTSYRSRAFQKDSNGNVYNLSSTRAENDFASFKTDFEEAVLVGTGGSGAERMLSSIEKSREYSPSWYSSTDSLLVFILLSDESEQSVFPNSSSFSTQAESDADLASWKGLLDSWKQIDGRVKLYPIINTSQDHLNRFNKIASQSNTNVYDIAQPFDAILNDISSSVSNLVTSFTLRSGITIESSSIKVYVDNVLQPSTSWNFSNNSVSFNTPPSAGTSIKVSYDYY